jgi:hypothetical protein
MMIKRQSVMWLLAVWALLAVSCHRRPLEEDELQRAASIAVKIDWSRSGINVTPGAVSGNGVHRASIRFFPKDNVAPIYEAYLEGNVSEGKIAVPVGNYSVIIYNESVKDGQYWDGAIIFSDIDSYDNFAASVAPHADASLRYPYYTPFAGERLIVEPLPLASWCLDDFEVTDGMVLVSQGQKPLSHLTEKEQEMLDALQQVVMRALTRPVYLTAQVENLVSMATGYMALQGVANKIYMASGITAPNTATILFTLGGRQYHAGGKDGTMNNRLLMLGHIPTSSAFTRSYQLLADILLASGDLYQPFPFDVTYQVASNYYTQHNIYLNIDIHLAFIDEEIGVEDWGDDITIPIR